MKKKALMTGAAFGALCIIVLLVWISRILTRLPDISVLKHYRPAAATELLDKDGNILAHYYDHKFRVWVPLSELPETVINAVVIAEDDTFFGHKGINYRATWDAFIHDLKKKKFARGGSTITQQMVKNVFLSREKTVGRKVREFILARQAEDLLTKSRILEIYLNEVEWGDNIYGIEAASRYYFDKQASELSAAEAALLAGMLPNPRYFNPFKRPDKARGRQERILFNMSLSKLLTEDEYQDALSSPLELRNESSDRFDFSALQNRNGRPCYQKVLEAILLFEYGDHRLYREGLRIWTHLDKQLQSDLNAWVELGKEATHQEGIPDSVIIVRENAEIRALVCSSNEEEVRFKLESLGPPYDHYDPTYIQVIAINPADVIVEEKNISVNRQSQRRSVHHQFLQKSREAT